jgi:hypothetical protein
MGETIKKFGSNVTVEVMRSGSELTIPEKTKITWYRNGI